MVMYAMQWLAGQSMARCLCVTSANAEKSRGSLHPQTVGKQVNELEDRYRMKCLHRLCMLLF